MVEFNRSSGGQTAVHSLIRSADDQLITRRPAFSPDRNEGGAENQGGWQSVGQTGGSPPSYVTIMASAGVNVGQGLDSEIPRPTCAWSLADRLLKSHHAE